MTSSVSIPVAFLGPEGTFTEEALLANMPSGDYHPYPYPTIRDVMRAVQEDEAALGIVPIENSLEGSVVMTMDLLAWSFDGLHITREITHSISHQLIARRPLELGRVTKIISHPHAYGQCRTFLNESLPGVEHEAANSTAEAARTVSRVDRPWVAIGTRLAADMYECVVLRDSIEDSAENRTRFVFLGPKEAPQDAEGRFKTSIVCAIAADQPGSLLAILSEFAERSVNLTKVESRPSKQGLGNYIFFIDMEGRRTDPAIAAALRNLEDRLAWIRVLGSFPA